MSKIPKTLSGKASKPRGRNGGRKPLPEGQRAVQTNLHLPSCLYNDFCESIPAASDRNKLLIVWVRAYLAARGECDRMLAQSPLAVKILNYLEAIEAPDELREELESLLVQRDIAENEIGNLGTAYIA